MLKKLLNKLLDEYDLDELIFSIVMVQFGISLVLLTFSVFVSTFLGD